MLDHTIQISGTDAASFLQGMITADVKTLKAPLMAAACNQKGRIIASFWIWQENDAFYLQLPTSMSSTLMAHLKKYVFRSQVEFKVTKKQPPSKPNFIPIWILPQTTEQFTPQMISLEKHGGVSFKKGCYLGQEIIARTEHLGKLKRHLYTFTLEKAVAANIGDEIMNKEGQKMGIIVIVSENDLLAVVEDRAVQESLYWQGHLLRLK